MINSTIAERATRQPILKQIATLFKLRVVSLLVFAAIGGAFLGAHGAPPVGALIAVVITGTLAAGGASGMNQYLERTNDRLMRRTQRRPLAVGHIEHPVLILWIAGAMILLAVLSVLPFNPPMALYLGLGAVIYVGVYTIWLKPRSVLNIVIGGAAGSCAVMTGGAAVGAASRPGVIVLALLVFLWTPVHFWALAMFYRDDYAAGDIPMLPVHVSAEQSARWILVHAVSTGLATVLLAVDPALGWPYLIPAALITAMLVIESTYLIRQPDKKQAIRLFIKSNLFLAGVLLAIILIPLGRQLFLS